MKFFVLLLVLCSFNAFSQDSEEFKKGFEAGKAAASKPIETPKAGDGQTSEENRADKKFEIGASYGADYTLVTQQLVLSAYVKSNDIVGLKVGSTSVQYGSYYHHKQLNISLFYKKFLANSFYISPEVVYLKRDTTEDDTFFSSQDNEFYRGFGAGARIGNQWMFKNFTIGCDWIGLGKLLIATENTERRQYYATLLNFYTGWAF